MEIQNVNTWLDADKLTLNEEKTEYMLIGSGKRLRQIRNDPIIKIRDHIIKRVYKKTVLGLEIDDKLQWTKHVEKQTKVICTPLVQLYAVYGMMVIKCTPKKCSNCKSVQHGSLPVRA